MKRRCECGKPAIGFAQARKRSGRATRTGKPVARKEHEFCPACWQKWCDRWRKMRMKGPEREHWMNVSMEELNAIEAEQRANAPEWFKWEDWMQSREGCEEPREPVAVVRGRGLRHE